jgi:hypothetical protein
MKIIKKILRVILLQALVGILSFAVGWQILELTGSEPIGHASTFAMILILTWVVVLDQFF